MAITNGDLTIERVFDARRSPPLYIYSLLNSTQAIVAPVIVAPVAGQMCVVGVAFAVTVTVPAGTVSATVQLGASAPVALSIIGTTGTAAVTPAGGDVGVSTALVVTTNTGASASVALDIENNAAFGLDAKNPASYTASGQTITALKSLVSGSSLATVVGTPAIVVDPRDGSLGFRFLNASDYVMGTDATFAAAAGGTDKPYTLVSVVTPLDAAGTGFYLSAANSADTSTSSSAALNAGAVASIRSGVGGFRNATSEGTKAGLSVIVQHSADGLTHKTSVNGGTETSTTVTSAGNITANRVGVGVAANSTPAFVYSGFIRELWYFSADKTAPQIAAIVASMLKKWRPPPVVHFVGDSITTASLATNGGMVTLLAQRVRAAGGLLDPQGPLATGQAFPYRHSGNSGDAPNAMLARVSSDTTGLGKGGSSKGYYSRTSLVLLMAGTNQNTSAAQTATDYSALLNAIETRLVQGVATGRIVVTPIMNVIGIEAYVTAFNALLPAIWDAYDAAHPTRPLIRWNANLANPNDGSGTYFVDGTHPNDAGYLRMVDHPTYGLAQAVLPYLLSVQPG